MAHLFTLSLHYINTLDGLLFCIYIYLQREEKYNTVWSLNAIFRNIVSKSAFLLWLQYPSSGHFQFCDTTNQFLF